MIRILHILNNLGSGGTETFVMNCYRKINRQHIQFDFLIRSPNNNYLIKEIESLGGRVFIMPNFPRKCISNYIETSRFLQSHKEYKILHVHANSLIYTLPLILGKQHHIPHRIIHSHSINCSGGFLGNIIHYLNRALISRWATDFLACSTDAAKWMFNNDDYIHINNGIDLQLYQYSTCARKIIRDKLNIHNDFVIGHVGRFLPVKNHAFIIDVFSEVLKYIPNSKLLLIGEGELPQNVKDKIESLRLAKSICFAGVVSNVHEYLSAMDAFIFPSLYEGLGIALIEAQANGLPCFVANTIPAESILNDNVFALNLCDKPSSWAQKIVKHAHDRIAHATLSDKLLYMDVRHTVQKLTDFYISKLF